MEFRWRWVTATDTFFHSHFILYSTIIFYCLLQVCWSQPVRTTLTSWSGTLTTAATRPWNASVIRAPRLNGLRTVPSFSLRQSVECFVCGTRTNGRPNGGPSSVERFKVLLGLRVASICSSWRLRIISFTHLNSLANNCSVVPPFLNKLCQSLIWTISTITLIIVDRRTHLRCVDHRHWLGIPRDDSWPCQMLPRLFCSGPVSRVPILTCRLRTRSEVSLQRSFPPKLDSNWTNCGITRRF